jgi:hypothetical protein
MANNTIAYGFVGLSDLFAQRVSQAGPARVYDAITETAAEYTRILDALMAWSQRTTIALEQFELPASGTLQPLDEWGNPLPVQSSGNYQVAYPIQGGGTAFGNNRISRAMMTVQEANRLTVQALGADKDWMLRHALAAVLTNTEWTYNDKIGPDGTKGLGDLTIKPLANGDSVVYNRIGGTAPATDNHYLAQAAAIADGTNPYPTIEAELNEHPSNSGDIVAYIATDLVATTAALTEFVEKTDPDITLGSGSDTLTGSAGDAVLAFGKKILGKTKSGIWVVEAPIIPSGYIVARSLGAGPFLRQREYPAAELQGFYTEMHSADGNTEITRFLRFCGFGVADRVAACVMRIGNGSYAIPTGYSAPLAV